MAARSPVMAAIHAFAGRGGHVLGVCNGFQILTEAGLLPGALLRNASLRFLSQDCHLRVERSDTPYTSHYQRGARCSAPPWPMATATTSLDEDARPLGGRRPGRRCATAPRTATLSREANPNGSARHIAGILSPNLRVMGLMPHPEDLVDPLMGGTDGLPLFQGMADSIAA